MSNLQIDRRLGRTICFSLAADGRDDNIAIPTSISQESPILVVAEVIACLSARLNYVSACPAASGKFCPTSPSLPLYYEHIRVHGRPPFCTVTRQLYFPIIEVRFRISIRDIHGNPVLARAKFESDRRRGRRRRIIIWIIFFERK